MTTNTDLDEAQTREEIDRQLDPVGEVLQEGSVYIAKDAIQPNTKREASVTLWIQRPAH